MYQIWLCTVSFEVTSVNERFDVLTSINEIAVSLRLRFCISLYILCIFECFHDEAKRWAEIHMCYCNHSNVWCDKMNDEDRNRSEATGYFYNIFIKLFLHSGILMFYNPCQTILLQSDQCYFWKNWQASIRGGDPWAGKNKCIPCLLYGLKCYTLPKSFFWDR